MSQELAKAKIKGAVSDSGAKMAALVKTLEAHGEEAKLSDEEFNKIFSFLHTTLSTLEGQARRDRVVISASNFDFDMEIEENPVIQMPLKLAPAGNKYEFKTETPLPPTEWKKPTGRISKNSPNKELAGKAVHVSLETKTAPDLLDNKGGDNPVGFIDANSKPKEIK